MKIKIKELLKYNSKLDVDLGLEEVVEIAFNSHLCFHCEKEFEVNKCCDETEILVRGEIKREYTFRDCYVIYCKDMKFKDICKFCANSRDCKKTFHKFIEDEEIIYSCV